MNSMVNSEIRKIVFHLDLDAFFAAVEIRNRPELHNIPVIIGADPKGGRGRGVVSTCSYAARKYGIHSGQPISRAYRLCPHGVYIRPSFKRYKKASHDVMSLIKEHIIPKGNFWQASIDECYLKMETTYLKAIKLAKKLKQRIKNDLSLTCSIGIAPTKIIAKIASDYKKPDGLTVVYPGKEVEFLSPLPIQKIPGIGKKTKKKLNETYNLFKIGQVASLSLVEAVNRYQDHGRYIWRISHGLTQSTIQFKPKSPSISSERTFSSDISDPNMIKNMLTQEASSLAKRLQKKQVFARTISLKIRFSDFSTYTRSKTLSRGETNSSKKIVQVCWNLYTKEFLNSTLPVRLIGIKCENLVNRRLYQTNLLDFFQ